MSPTNWDPYAGWQSRYPDYRAFGYLCSYVPEELIHAAGFTPVRIMPSASPVTRADAHLQSYTCGLARSCLDQAIAGNLDFLSGVLFAHSCDTMQGLADIWRARFPNIFVDAIAAPVALDTPHAQPYWVAELHRLANAVERHFSVTITEDALRASIRLYNRRRRDLADYVARDSITAVERFEVMNAALVAPPEEFGRSQGGSEERGGIPRNSWSDGEVGSVADSRVPIILVGSTIDELTLPQLLDELGARVVADDVCNGSRYYETLAAEDGDPFQALAERALYRAPCPCKHRSLDARVDRLVSLTKSHEARGVVFCLKKFCDPHAWDYVPLSAALARMEIPTLLLEMEQAAPVGQLRVRVEAFLEMLSGL